MGKRSRLINDVLVAATNRRGKLNCGFDNSEESGFVGPERAPASTKTTRDARGMSPGPRPEYRRPRSVLALGRSGGVANQVFSALIFLEVSLELFLAPELSHRQVIESIYQRDEGVMYRGVLASRHPVAGVILKRVGFVVLDDFADHQSARGAGCRGLAGSPGLGSEPMNRA